MTVPEKSYKGNNDVVSQAQELGTQDEDIGYPLNGDIPLGPNFLLSKGNDQSPDGDTSMGTGLRYSQLTPLRSRWKH